jgi:hypothetical protein
MEVRLLDSISKKLLPAGAAQDGPQNQTESKPATIEAEAVSGNMELRQAAHEQD